MPFKGTFALIIAYLATLFYIAAMCAPWWYQQYHVPDNNNNDAFFSANPGLNPNSNVFDRTNCFIDGSCISSGVIYKNNGNLQWVFTVVLILMIVGWVPWLIYVHLLHFARSNYHQKLPGRKVLLFLSALLTMAFLTAAIITFAAGLVKSSTVYDLDGLYGDLLVTVAGVNGLLGFRYGAHAAWYFAIIALALIPLSLLLSLFIREKKKTTVVTQTTTERTVRTDGTAVVGGVPQMGALSSPGLSQRRPNRAD